MTAWKIFKRIIKSCRTENVTPKIVQRISSRNSRSDNFTYRLTDAYMTDLEKRIQDHRCGCIFLCKSVREFANKYIPIEHIKRTVFLEDYPTTEELTQSRFLQNNEFMSEDEHQDISDTGIYGKNERGYMDKSKKEIPLQQTMFDGIYDLEDLCNFMDEEFPNLVNDWD